MATYYKVVYRGRDGSMFPAIMSGCGIEYKVGEWTRPYDGYGPLCVFDSWEGVGKFRKQCSGYVGLHCFQCSIEPSKHAIVWSRSARTEIKKLPAGTVLADAVKLEKELSTLFGGLT